MPFESGTRPEQPPAAARARKLPLRTPRLGSGKRVSEEVIGIELPAPASATAPAKDGFGKGSVSLSCGADLFWIYRASPRPSML